MIIEDLKMLCIVPDRWTHTSDSFEFLLQKCEQLLTEGKAYADNTDAETMKEQREKRQESKNRNLCEFEQLLFSFYDLKYVFSCERKYSIVERNESRF